MSAIEQLADFVSDPDRKPPADAIQVSRDALIDTIACCYAGADQPVTRNSIAAMQGWGGGKAKVFGTGASLAAPFAALVNGGSAHALDFDDFDGPANAHPSAVIFPAILALATEHNVTGWQLLDAHVVGVEVMQRLGEAMNMDHYRRGWLTTLTLGSLGAAAACARLAGADFKTAAASLSLASSMASGLTNQGGFQAKQLNPGFAAKNGVMAHALAAAGVDASHQVIDGPISLARSMGDYDAGKFTAALAKLGKPWSILEYGLITKAYPSCGYTHRLIDAAIELHGKLPQSTRDIDSIQISIPDYYLDLLVYPRPGNTAEAMFSAEYNVAAALLRGQFGLAELAPESIFDDTLKKLTSLCQVTPRSPLDPDTVYDPDDPDRVEVSFANGERCEARVGLPTGSPQKPMSEAQCRDKFDQCLQGHMDSSDRSGLWQQLNQFEQLQNLDFLLAD